VEAAPREGKQAITALVVASADDLRVGTGHARGSLRHHRLLQMTGRLEIRQCRFLRLDGRRRLGERGPIVTVVELDEQVARANRLIVRDDDSRDESCDLRGDHGYVAADIGVVGRLDEAPDRPPLMAVSDRGNRNDGDRAR
jgi:hypothetical protein